MSPDPVPIRARFDQRLLSRVDEIGGRLGVLPSAIGAALGSWLLSWMIFFGPNILPGVHWATRFDDVYALCRNPFQRGLHEPFLAYRMTVPLVGWLLGLENGGLLAIQYGAIVGTLACVYVAMLRRTGKPRYGLLAALIVALTYAVQWTTNHLGHFDSVTHFCAGLCLLFPQPLAVVVLTLAGTMNDERFVLSIPFLVLWHADLRCGRTLLASGWRLAVSFLLGLSLVLLSRAALARGWIGPGIAPPRAYKQMDEDVIRRFHPFESDWLHFGYNVFAGFRWAWLLPIYALLAGRTRARIGIVAKVLFGVCLVLGTLSALLVADVSKSIGFLYPAVLIGFASLLEAQPARANRWLSILSAALLLTPTFVYFGVYREVLRPVPLEFVRYHRATASHALVTP